MTSLPPKMHEDTRESFVYFMREVRPEAPHDELIKIGVSINVWQRLEQLETEHRVKLRMLAIFPGTRVEEKKLHDLFSSFCVRGREWFLPCEEIQALLTSGELPLLHETELVRPPKVNKRMLNLYLPEEDGEEIVRLARHAAIDAGISFNTWFFRTVRAELGLDEPSRARRKARAA